jgi:SGNH domain (fused to AT3 domains)
VLFMVRPVPVGTRAAAAPVAVAAPGPSTAPRALTPQEQLQAAVAVSAESRAVPTNLTPPLGAVGKPEVFVNGCVLSWRDVNQPECAAGDTASTTTVALVGDSHAAMWHPALEPIAQQRHWRLETMTKVTCPLMDLPITSPYLGRKFTECERWRADVLTRLDEERPRLIVLDMVRRYGTDFGFTTYDQAWLDSITRLVKRLRDTGAHVLVLGPVPDPHSTVPTCLSAHMDDAFECSPVRSVALNDNGIAAEVAATAAGGGDYADISALFCTAERCPVIVGNTLVYRDDNHVTIEYAQLLGPILADLVDHALGVS